MGIIFFNDLIFETGDHLEGGGAGPAKGAISIAATLASSPLAADAFGVFSPGGVLLNVFLVFLNITCF